MPPLTVSRLREVSLAVDAFESRLRGLHHPSSGPLEDVCARFALAVGDVNAALGEVRELLVAGLRDEAVSLHDPELIPIARRLGLQDRSDWERIHVEILSQGLAIPDDVDLLTVDDFEAARQEAEALGHTLDRLRRLVLERAALTSRLAVIRELEGLDPHNPVWTAAKNEHETAIIAEFERHLPVARQRRDIDTLAEMESTLADGAWGAEPPPRLWRAVEGAGRATALRDCVRGIEVVAAEITRRPPDPGLAPAVVDELGSLADRFEAALAAAADHVAALAAHPEVLELVRSRGDHAVCDGLRLEVAPLIERIRAAQRLLGVRRAFHEGCCRLEQLCDHLPAAAAASRWIADLERTDADVRRCCQDLPDLQMSPLLQERVWKARETVGAEIDRGRRFSIVLVATAAIALVCIVGLAGWWLWQKAEWDGRLDELRSEVAAARAGHRRERPGFVERMWERYGDDPRVASLVEDFDSGILGERERRRRFEELMASVTERQPLIARKVAARAAAGDDEKLAAWPEPLVEAMRELAEARAIGGLPEQRGGSAAGLPGEVREQLQAEENRIATAEQALAASDRQLERSAVEVFESRLAELRGGLVGSPVPASVERIRTAAANLRASALEPRGPAQAGAALARPRIPPEVSAGLDSIDERLRILARERGP